MRTKTSDFLNFDTMKPDFSFQYFDGRKREGTWRYPLIPGTKEPMRWAEERDRNEAQSLFRRRKTVAAAYADLARSPVAARGEGRSHHESPAAGEPRQLYCVVEGRYVGELTEQVQEKLDQGWQLSGGVVVAMLDIGERFETWAQALTKLEEPSQ